MWADYLSKVDPSVVVSLVTLVGGWLWHKLGARKQSRVERVLAIVENLVGQLARTFAPDAPAETLIVQAKAIAHSVLVKFNLDRQKLAPYVDEIISRAVHRWTEKHAAPTTIKLPIVENLPAWAKRVGPGVR